MLWVLLAAPLLLAACAPVPGFWEEVFEALFALVLLALLAAGAWALWQRGVGRLPGSSATPLTSRLRALRLRAQELSPEQRSRLEALILEAWEALEEGRRGLARERLQRAEAYLEFVQGERG
ncbi:hypothetical protein [Calidithermus roseus]|uniref:Uncharacterized protein n=1 Tax=Calidithermus roseus TaxID=1644118 RepID=A0A399EP62_9DEIN|nr:hypothetical protein [Calidithermus roseus]RIH84272.1 hypothetical protein Mrose_02703 [Calidithermus roseus]